MQALVHAFQSIFTCSRDESPLHPLELTKSEINARGAQETVSVGSIWMTAGWAGIGGRFFTKLISYQHQRGLCPSSSSSADPAGCHPFQTSVCCCHAVGRERGSVV